MFKVGLGVPMQFSAIMRRSPVTSVQISSLVNVGEIVKELKTNIG